MKKVEMIRDLEVSVIVDGADIRFRIKTEEEVTKKTRVDYTKCVSKSQMFKQLYTAGLEVCEIAKITESHYSFVYGRVRENDDVSPKRVVGESKSDKMRAMFDQGMTVSQIAKELDSNYSFVHGVIKKYKATKPVQDLHPMIIETAE